MLEGIQDRDIRSTKVSALKLIRFKIYFKTRNMAIVLFLHINTSSQAQQLEHRKLKSNMIWITASKLVLKAKEEVFLPKRKHFLNL